MEHLCVRICRNCWGSQLLPYPLHARISLLSIEDLTSHNVDPHAVEGRRDIVWRFGLGCSVVEVDMHVGQHGLARTETPDQVKGFWKTEMAGMRRWSQSVDDPEVEIADRFVRAFGKTGQIAAIGEIVQAESERVDIAVQLQKSL